MRQAVNEIKLGSVLAYDVAVSFGQIFDNVKHMSWFRQAVAAAIDKN